MPGRGTAGMHAFLFADLRGYTRFAATRGDHAAADLLGRYRALVRAEIGRHDGAEIRTEGDSFYVVFPSVSGAVRCALAIVSSARASTLEDPSLPIDVGVGVHFGETVDTAEGSVGSAVNLAARLASAAGPNEVIVSDVVVSLTRTLADVRTKSLGPRRLKGFAEPVVVFRVLAREGAARAVSSAWPWRHAPSIAVLAGLPLVLLIALVLDRAGDPAAAPSATGSASLAADASPSPGAEATPIDFAYGQLAAGRYLDRGFVPNVTVQVDDGWCGGFFSHFLQTRPGPDMFYLYSPGSPTGGLASQQGDPCLAGESDDEAGSVSLYRVEQVYGATACSDGVTRSINGSWNELVDYLTTLPGTSIADRVSAQLGGAIGVAYDLHVDEAPSCPQSGAPGPAVLAFPTTVVDRTTGRSRVEPRWVGEGQYLRVWVVDVDGRPVVAFLGRIGATTPASDAFLRKAYPVLESLRFIPSA